MKRIFKLLGLCLGAILLFGCNKKPAKPSHDKAAILAWVETQIPAEIGPEQTLKLQLVEPQSQIAVKLFVLEDGVVNDSGVVILPTGTQTITYAYEFELDGTPQMGTLQATTLVHAHTAQSLGADFANQFRPLITRDYDVDVFADSGAIITWNSDKPQVFSNEGKYTQPMFDEVITITYQVKYEDQVFEGSLEVTAKGIPVTEKLDTIKSHIRNKVLSGRKDVLTNESEFILTYEPYEATITWSVSDPNVIDRTAPGFKLKQFIFPRYFNLIANIAIPRDDITNEQIHMPVRTLGTNPTTPETVVAGLLELIAPEEAVPMNFSAYGNIRQSYGKLRFDAGQAANVVEMLMPITSASFETSRPGTKLTSLEFITIHDTANNNAGAGGETHARLLINGYSSASWHFCIDDTGSYQSIPTDEVAWHAGDGGRAMGLTNTKIASEHVLPITISDDGFYVFGNTKSTIAIPAGAKPTSSIASSGIYSTVIDGEIWVNNTYFNSGFGAIANHGGNRHSIGIETAVNAGSDYNETVRETARLVSDLLIANNLDIDRVLQHNNFSGKYCPRAMRDANYWYDFLDLIQTHLLVKKYVPSLTITCTPATHMLAADGTISLEVTTIKEKGNVDLPYKLTLEYQDSSNVTQTQTIEATTVVRNIPLQTN